MKPISLIGIVLIVVGALALAYQGFNYTREKNVVDMGPVHVTSRDSRAHCSPSNTGRAGVGRWRNFACRGREEQIIARPKHRATGVSTQGTNGTELIAES